MGEEGKSAEVDSDLKNLNSEPQIAHVSFKPPVFDETSASKWFRIVESMFATSRITVSATKFNHVLGNLPIGVVNKLIS